MSIEKEMVRIACKALDDKKAKDIKIIDIHEVSVIADYFVIASASNQNQVQAMVDNADEMLGRAGYEAKQIEGTRNSSWVLMDYGDMIIHIFDELDGKAENAEISPRAVDLRGLLDAVALMKLGLSPLDACDMGLSNKVFDSTERASVHDVIAARVPKSWN